MKPGKTPPDQARAAAVFSAQEFLDSSAMAKTAIDYARGATIFAQGDRSEDVLYIRSGGVKISVQSKIGREAVVAMLGPGDFFGEGCLAGQALRMAARPRSRRARSCSSRSRRWCSCSTSSMGCRTGSSRMLSRNIRIERICRSAVQSERETLARALLLLARYGKQDQARSSCRKSRGNAGQEWSAPRARA